MLATISLVAMATVPFIFGDEDEGWYVLSESGKLIEHRTDFAGERAAHVALSSDGATFAFVTAGATDSRRLLMFRRGDPSARPLKADRGYYAHPAFSPDGAWVYFAHSAAGPPGQHAGGMNAQVFRVRLDGSQLEQLTYSEGCKSAAAPTTSSVFYLHSSCQRTAGAEVLPITLGEASIQEPRAFGQSGWNVVELSVSGDGRRVVVVEARGPGVVLHEYATSGRKPSRVLAQFAEHPSALQPQWNATGNAVLVRVGRELWKLPLSGKPLKLGSLNDNQPMP